MKSEPPRVQLHDVAQAIALRTRAREDCVLSAKRPDCGGSSELKTGLPQGMFLPAF
jgi:hypothetical protein